jgi:NAD(P) transhydrogenase subunit beta
VISILFLIYKPAGYFAYGVFLLLLAASLTLGVLGVTPIGGADMPVVIALLNSYSGLAACAAGFILLNNVLIVAGSLVGASGLILTGIMCKAMNRSLANVLFSGFEAASGKTVSATVQGDPKPISPEDAYYILEAAGSVVIVPGYGMAVAQAQHAVRELGEILENNGAEVRYAIHPVAGRMPGHMNVLLAEANVLYEQLAEMDDVNPIMETVDVCMVIGANDVVNPAAREVQTSPIYGMPIINVDKAKTVIVLKRSMAAGFAGVENPLFVKENTRMLFGDAKATVQQLVAEFKEG